MRGSQVRHPPRASYGFTSYHAMHRMTIICDIRRRDTMAQTSNAGIRGRLHPTLGYDGANIQRWDTMAQTSNAGIRWRVHPTPRASQIPAQGRAATLGTRTAKKNARCRRATHASPIRHAFSVRGGLAVGHPGAAPSALPLATLNVALGHSSGNLRRWDSMAPTSDAGIRWRIHPTLGFDGANIRRWDSMAQTSDAGIRWRVHPTPRASQIPAQGRAATLGTRTAKKNARCRRATHASPIRHAFSVRRGLAVGLPGAAPSALPLATLNVALGHSSGNLRRWDSMAPTSDAGIRWRVHPTPRASQIPAQGRAATLGTRTAKKNARCRRATHASPIRHAFSVRRGLAVGLPGAAPSALPLATLNVALGHSSGNIRRWDSMAPTSDAGIRWRVHPTPRASQIPAQGRAATLGTRTAKKNARCRRATHASPIRHAFSVRRGLAVGLPGAAPSALPLATLNVALGHSSGNLRCHGRYCSAGPAIRSPRRCRCWSAGSKVP